MAKQKITKRSEILDDLEARFLDGERMDTEQVIKEYFATNQYSTYLKNLSIVRSLFGELKKRMTRDQGLWFGRLNDLGQFGVIDTEEEAVFVITKYYNLVKGNIRRVVQLRDEAQTKGLLKGVVEERFLLPKIIDDNEDKD